MGHHWSAFIAYGRDRNATRHVETANRQLLRRIGTKPIPDSDLRRIDVPARSSGAATTG